MLVLIIGVGQYVAVRKRADDGRVGGAEPSRAEPYCPAMPMPRRELVRVFELRVRQDGFGFAGKREAPGGSFSFRSGSFSFRSGSFSFRSP